MTDPDQVRAYGEANFDASNQRFLTLFQQQFPDFCTGPVVDLGCGTAEIAWRFAHFHAALTIWAVDGSSEMLAYARQRWASTHEFSRVVLVHDLLPSVHLPPHRFTAVLSNSFLHHLHRPEVLWETMLRCGAPGAKILVVDLRRPESEQEVSRLTETYVSNAPAVLQNDYRASLRAAFRVAEVSQQLAEAGLTTLTVQALDDRYLMVWGTLPPAPG